MQKTILSSKGQVIIPKILRTTLRWESGTTLEVLATDDGVLLKAVSALPSTSLMDVAGCLPYQGQSKTLAEMDAAIAQGVTEHCHDRS